MKTWIPAAALLLGLAAPVRAEDPAPAPAPTPAPEAPAPAPMPDRIVVKTELVANEAAPDPTKPLKRTGTFVPQGSVLVEFEPAAADAAPALPAGEGTVLRGVLEAGSRRIPVALRRGEGTALEVFADGDGDGRIDPAKERWAPEGREWAARTAIFGTEWPVEGAALGGTPVLLLVREQKPSFVGQVLVPAASRVERPQTAPLVLVDDKPAAVKTEPKAQGKTRWALARAGGKDVVLALVRGEGESLSVVLDLATKGDLAAAEAIPMGPRPTMRGKKRIGTRWESPVVRYGDGQVVFVAVETVGGLTAMANALGTRRGEAEVAGAPWAAFLVDADLDGSFTGPDDLWWVGPKASEQRPNPANMTEGSEPRWVGDEAWRLAGVDGEGTATFTRAPDAGPFEEYLRRRTERVNRTRWFPRFEADAEFAKSRGIDATRPKAETPAAWHFARTLEEAKAFAAAQGKPLLVDFEADWCVWCKRLDYYTYPDREVAEWLSKFAAVKINNEFDPAQSFKGMKTPLDDPWGGIPAVAAFGPDGKPVVFLLPGVEGRPGAAIDRIPGWLKPDLFAAALKSLHEQVERLKAGEPPLKMEPRPAKPPANHPPMGPKADPRAHPFPEGPKEGPAEAPKDAPQETPKDAPKDAPPVPPGEAPAPAK